MRLKIHHTTRYRFDTPVVYGLQQLRETPMSEYQQKVLSWDIQITGGKRQLTFEDYHNNITDLVSFDKDATELTVTCTGEVELHDNHGILGRHSGFAPMWLFRNETPRTKLGPGGRALIRGMSTGSDLDRLHMLVERIRNAVSYEVGSSESDWNAEDAISAGRGVCQDHAHVFLACARAMGFPARYVSGYLMLDDRTTQDAMHAWAEAHLDGLGWVGFDVSNGISPDVRYVRVATGLDYAEAAPVSGTRIGGTGEALDVVIEVAQQ